MRNSHLESGAVNLVEKHGRITGQAECPLEVCGQKCEVRPVSVAVNFPQ